MAEKESDLCLIQGAILQFQTSFAYQC